ncbi:hypothetical protein [Pseudomonas sp.]|uniref:hypothetical protein n=1 Tax=Pseudomonas sp. TaxID=306 RepID=UPI00289802CF|nr:hypothetical protein [Pseudomonas sp.]
MKVASLAGGALLILFACVSSGLLGLTAGINLNPDSTIKFVPNWGSMGDWLAGLSALLTFVVACIAMNVWRIQERQRLVLQWKADLVDYTWTLPHLEDELIWPKDRDCIARISDRFYGCIRSYSLMIEYVKPDKHEFYEGIWDLVEAAHTAYIGGKATRHDTRKVFVEAYLNKFL